MYVPRYDGDVVMFDEVRTKWEATRTDGDKQTRKK